MKNQPEEIDLFEHYESLPTEVREYLSKYSNMDNSYEICQSLEDELKPLGYTFEWELDAQPFNLKKIQP